jgi:DNA mismatch repair protein MutS2
MVHSPPMDEKTLQTLEYDTILDRLATYAAFGASREKALALRPVTDLYAANRILVETTEARLLLDTEPSTTIGGARDVREQVEGASRGVVLTPGELLDVKATLISARSLGRQLERSSVSYPYLTEIALRFPGPMGLIDAISHTVSERGEVLDSASSKLGNIRSELRIAHDRLLTRMQRLLNNEKIAPFLQDALVTQRDGRYVLPVRAEAKGRVKSVVHDVSSSGATLFVEPLQVVELNNQWRELQVAERDEVRRVLAELTDKIGEHSFEIISAVETLADLDLIFAKAKYADALKASEPVLKEFSSAKDSSNPGLTLRLWQARHPLLDPETVMPIDVEVAPEKFVLLITGPNTGGKTVTLKTVGLLACMAQSGMHIPVQAGSEMSIFKAIYADIGDEQSIEQSLSTFSGHIITIIRILVDADQESLVVLDELGAGTDPQEGAALAMAILTFLVERSIPTLVATHYPELKAYAHSTPGVVNASVEFDLETLRPTFHLTVGLPGRSNALAIAKRLGLREDIVELARKSIDPAELKAEDLLDEIHRQRDLTRNARIASEAAQREVEMLREELSERLEKIEDERLEILTKAQEEAQAEMDALQEELRKVRSQLAHARQPLETIQQVEEKVRELEEEIETPVERQGVAQDIPQVAQRDIRLGDKVKLRTLGKDGIVTSLSEEEAEIQIGNLRVRVELFDLDLVSGKVDEKTTEDVPEAGSFRVESPGLELSLRGMAVDEALDALENYIDRAYVAGLPFVRIVHGKGTGKLRNAVRNELKKHSHIERFDAGGPTEGGDGVTVAFLKQG